MRLAAGTRLGAYTVDAPLGAGGMGEVYRARDTTLGRDVALKVLPDAFATDPDRLARFKREAQVLASLNHPNIAAIHGFEDGNGVSALVLEFVDGSTLADRIAQGPIPLDQALSIARQMADAVDAAHEHGVIHRDLKPSNIKLRPDGTVKVLDFGLAKALDADGTSGDPSQSPTITSPALTRMGVVLGTAAYMSPEQARGRAADKRSDVWAFGCVLYEMLSGTRAFGGAETSDTIAAVLRADPEWAALPASVPDAIVRLLHRCLEKDHTRRLRDIGDARLEIDEAQRAPRRGAPEASGAWRHRERLAWIAVVVVVAAAGAAAWWLAPRATPGSEVRVDIATPPTADDVSLALSPDGERIAFVATTDGQPRLWLRSLDSVVARPLAGTEGAAYPFWSPDGRSIAFFANNTLKRIDVAGGPAQTLTNTSPGRGGTWNRDGVILFASLDGALRRVSDKGGESTVVTHVDTPRQMNHRFPQFLPDGQHFLLYVRGAPDVQGVYVASLDGTPPRRLLGADSAAWYTSGHIFFIRQGALLAQSFDAARLEPTGDAAAIAEPIAVDATGLGAALSVSTAGPVAYRAASASGGRQLVWFDRSGAEIRKVGSPDTATLLHPELSADGRRVAVARNVNGNQDVWIVETARGVLNPFTFDAAIEDYPIWSPDARHVIFQSNRKGAFDLYMKSTSGDGGETMLLSTPTFKSPTDWSPDGRFVLYRTTDPETGYDLWALPLDSKTQPFPLAQTNAEERDGQFSPDGRWIAYQSNESGRFEIYVQAFPKPQERWRISTNGGAQVRWRHDGRELFYLALDGQLMAVPLRLDSQGQTVDAGTPVPLFRPRLVGGAVRGVNRQQYAVSSDGREFLINTPTEDTPVSPITLILNWKPTR